MRKYGKHFLHLPRIMGRGGAKVDQISTADLVNLVLTQRGSIDLQFQFWLTITFAVIVAAFTARDRLAFRLRLLVAVLYFLASAHLMTRWAFDGTVAERWVEILMSRGVDIGIPWVAVSLRLVLMVVGSAAALVFLLKTPQRKSNDSQAPTAQDA
ncbi:MAG: hypothetical protein FIB04_12705 [Gammaproteobacteria bacterium]|nr:hypothetical protein [Gammaproteobacteria bacterium]